MRCKSNLCRYFQNENTLMSKPFTDAVLTSQNFGSNLFVSIVNTLEVITVDCIAMRNKIKEETISIEGVMQRPKIRLNSDLALILFAWLSALSVISPKFIIFFLTAPKLNSIYRICQVHVSRAVAGPAPTPPVSLCCWLFDR